MATIAITTIIILKTQVMIYVFQRKEISTSFHFITSFSLSMCGRPVRPTPRFQMCPYVCLAAGRCHRCTSCGVMRKVIR